MRSLEEEISAGELELDVGPPQPELGFLLEASDDAWGEPEEPAGADAFGAQIGGFEDEIDGYAYGGVTSSGSTPDCSGSATSRCGGSAAPRMAMVGRRPGRLAVVRAAAAHPHSDGRGRQQQSSPEQEDGAGRRWRGGWPWPRSGSLCGRVCFSFFLSRYCRSGEKRAKLGFLLSSTAGGGGFPYLPSLLRRRRDGGEASRLSGRCVVRCRLVCAGGARTVTAPSLQIKFSGPPTRRCSPSGSHGASFPSPSDGGSRVSRRDRRDDGGDFVRDFCSSSPSASRRRPLQRRRGDRRRYAGAVSASLLVWRRSGRGGRPCEFAGLRQADLVFFLDTVDGSGRIRRSTTSLGLSPDRRATAICAAPSGASVARFIKPFPAMELRRLLGAMVSVFSSPGGRSAAPAVRVAVVWVVQSFLQFVRAFVFFSFAFVLCVRVLYYFV